MQTTKAKLTDLTGRVRDAAKQGDPVAAAIVDIVRLSIDELKESLVTAEGVDIQRHQGAARQLSKLLRELTVAPPNITPGA